MWKKKRAGPKKRRLYQPKILKNWVIVYQLFYCFLYSDSVTSSRWNGMFCAAVQQKTRQFQSSVTESLELQGDSGVFDSFDSSLCLHGKLPCSEGRDLDLTFSVEEVQWSRINLNRKKNIRRKQNRQTVISSPSFFPEDVVCFNGGRQQRHVGHLYSENTVWAETPV